MTDNTKDRAALIRAAGGIVHSDGNIFFTNFDQFAQAAVQHARSEPALSRGDGEAVAWLIEYEHPDDGAAMRAVYLHNAIGDYRAFAINAKSTPLYRAPAGEQAAPHGGLAGRWVPAEPTEEMIEAGCSDAVREVALAEQRAKFPAIADSIGVAWCDEVRHIYLAMLAAAPAAGAGKDGA